MSPHYAPSGAAFQVLVSPAAADLLERSRRALDLDPENPAAWLERLPFGPGDATAGAENELQTAVVGEREAVDLPRRILASSYYRNLERKAAAGDTPVRRLQELNAFITDNPDRVWEHSWVRFSRDRLSDFARSVLETDLLADKRQPRGPCRGDCECFHCQEAGENLLRLPVSYLLKLALAAPASWGIFSTTTRPRKPFPSSPCRWPRPRATAGGWRPKPSSAFCSATCWRPTPTGTSSWTRAASTPWSISRPIPPSASGGSTS
jgi:hypothetical protein